MTTSTRSPYCERCNGTYRATRKITHPPPEWISEPSFSIPGRVHGYTHTTKVAALERSRRYLSMDVSLRVWTLAVVEKIGLKIVRGRRGGVLFCVCYCRAWYNQVTSYAPQVISVIPEYHLCMFYPAHTNRVPQCSERNCNDCWSINMNTKHPLYIFVRSGICDRRFNGER